MNNLLFHPTVLDKQAQQPIGRSELSKQKDIGQIKAASNSRLQDKLGELNRRMETLEAEAIANHEDVTTNPDYTLPFERSGWIQDELTARNAKQEITTKEIDKSTTQATEDQATLDWINMSADTLDSQLK
jgi:uncharacterized coiled-coil protein SlyX